MHTTQMPVRAALTIQEVADLLAVSPDTIQRRIQDGTIRAIRLGLRSVRVPADEVRRLLGGWETR